MSDEFDASVDTSDYSAPADDSFSDTDYSSEDYSGDSFSDADYTDDIPEDTGDTYSADDSFNDGLSEEVPDDISEDIGDDSYSDSDFGSDDYREEMPQDISEDVGDDSYSDSDFESGDYGEEMPQDISEDIGDDSYSDSDFGSDGTGEEMPQEITEDVGDDSYSDNDFGSDDYGDEAPQEIPEDIEDAGGADNDLDGADYLDATPPDVSTDTVDESTPDSDFDGGEYSGETPQDVDADTGDESISDSDVDGVDCLDEMPQDISADAGEESVPDSDADGVDYLDETPQDISVDAGEESIPDGDIDGGEYSDEMPQDVSADVGEESVPGGDIDDGYYLDETPQAVAADTWDNQMPEGVTSGDVNVENDGSSESMPESTEPSAYDRLYDYYTNHDYNQSDFAEYSKDPEWQNLNNAYLQEMGEEPIDYGDDSVDFRDELIAAGIPEDSPELEAILVNEQDGIESLNEDIQDSTIPNNQFANDETEMSSDEYSLDNAEPTDVMPNDNPEQVEIEDNMPEKTPREYDDFEQSVIEATPDFYEDGSFYEQGVNEFGYEGTCGPTSQANALNELFDTNEFTENKVLNVAVDNDLCSIDSSPENCGGTTTEQFMELYDKMNEQLGGKINTELYEYNNALDVEDVAAKLDEGCVLNVAVDSAALWDEPREYVDSMGVPCDDFYSDHWITVTGVQRDEAGSIQGFNIIDSGGGESYVDADKYHEMCFGTEDHRVIDPTTIVVQKNDSSAGIEIKQDTDTEIDNENNKSWLQRLFGRRNS